MIQRNLFSLVLLIAICLAPSIASADDFAPPPWLRSHPQAVTAEWEFATPTNPLGPDGPLSNVMTKGSGTAPGGTSALITGSAAGLGWGMGDGDGGWFFPDGGAIRFRVDNIVDQMPFKHIWMQVTHTPMLGLAVDPLGPFNFGATGSLAAPVTMTPHGPTSTIFHWDMLPNPPWEDFRLVVFGAGEIDQIVVDTISIPEPSAIALFTLLALSIGAATRTRRASR